MNFAKLIPVFAIATLTVTACAGFDTYTPGRHGHAEAGTGTRLSGDEEPPADQTKSLDPSLRNVQSSAGMSGH
jgi:hypothetical protein